MVPVATRFLVLNVPPQTVMILRVFPAGIIGLLMAIYLGVKPMPWRAWARIAAAAIIGNVGYQVLSIYGAQYLPASWIGMLFGLEPVFIALFAVVLAGDKITSWLVGGMLLALAGAITLMLGNMLVPAKDVGLLGLVLVTLGTMGWGIYTVLVRPVSAQYGSIQIASLTLGISAFPMLLFLTPDFPSTLQAMNSSSGWSCPLSLFSAPSSAPSHGTLRWGTCPVRSPECSSTSSPSWQRWAASYCWTKSSALRWSQAVC